MWQHMVKRCHDTKDPKYPLYGARGVVVCEAWVGNFPAFAHDMGPRPGVGYTLERIDNEKGYSPENCKWATRTEQNRNRRSNVRLTLGQETLTIAEWSARTGLAWSTIKNRKRQGLNDQDALALHVATPAEAGRKRRSRRS